MSAPRDGSMDNPPPVPPSASGRRRRSAWFYLWGFCGGGLVSLALLVAGLILYASTPQFANLIRKKVIAALESSTGGRVELQSFRWNVMHLAVEADNLTIHGLEGGGEAPYAHIDRLYVRARILSLFTPEFALDYLEADHPVFHLIVYPDGSTNQPVPWHKAKSGTSMIDTVFDLQVQRAVVNNGLAVVNQRAIPFHFAANDLGAVVTYAPAKDHYLGEVQIADLDMQRGAARPLHSKLSVQVELARNGAELKALHFASGVSQFDASGSITDFAHPQWKISTQGSVNLREFAALVGIDGLNGGTARLNLLGQGAGTGQFSISGNAQLVKAVYETSFLQAEGVNATASLKVTPEEISLTGVNARLSDGSSVNAVVRFLHWNAPPSSGAAASAHISRAARAAPAVVKPVVSIRAQVHGMRLPMVLRMVAVRRYQNLGFDTAADGIVNVDWTGSGSDLTVAAKVQLSVPVNPAPGEMPVSGFLDAKYFERGGKVRINQLEAHSRSTGLRVTGTLGVYPVTGSSALEVNLATSNLAEFDRALTDLGLTEHGRSGVAAIPVLLHGEGEFSGTLAGSLIDPDVKGHLTATNFATTFSMARGVLGVLSPRKEAPAANSLASFAPEPAIRTIHWDRLDATGEYSSQLISIQYATLTSGRAKIDLRGELHAHRLSSRRSAFDDSSVFAATAHIHQASLGDLLAITGESVPASGTVGLQVHAGGSLENLNGGGNLDLRGGEIMGEPYHNLTANLRFNGHSINLVNLTLLQDGGTAVANGMYDLESKDFLANLDASNFELAHVHRLQNVAFPVTGSLNFDAHASGKLESPSVLVGVHLKNLTLRGHAAGDFEALAHTQGNVIAFTAHSTLTAPRLELSGQTVLRGELPTQAKLIFANLDIAPFLKALNVQNVTGHSLIGGTVNLAGPAREPRQLSGDAEIDQFSATLEDITLKSQGPLRASYRDGVIRVTQAHITGPETDMEISGTADLMGSRPLNLNASGSINMTLAESLDSDITSSGHVDFNVEAAGTLAQPLLTGQVRLSKVAMSLNDVPTGISNLNGTLVFDQDRLEVQNLIGTTGGGQLKLTGFITYQQGIYGDLTATGKNIRVRYSGVSATADTTLHLQGSQANMLLSGNIMITRFVVGPNLDFAVFAGPPGASPPPNPNAASNHVRLDVRVLSSPQLDFQNSYAQLAGSVDLRIRGTVAQPSVLGRINITEGRANFAGTTYQLQRGEIYFTNPVRIDPVIDIDATTRIEEYDVTVGMHGSASHLTPTFRSEPPLAQADVISLLALGRTQEEEQAYSQVESQVGVNSTTNALLGGALNAAVGSRVQRLFGVGSVKIDPTYLGNLGNSTARITVQQNISRSIQLTYATNVNTTAEQLIQAQVNLTDSVSVVAVRDESDVFSLVLKVRKRFR